MQVLSNGGVATIFTLFYCLEDGCVETPIDFVKSYSASWWSVSVLGAISCSCGDTLASELGPVLPFSQPYLVTSFQRVPKGITSDYLKEIKLSLFCNFRSLLNL